MGVSFEMAGLSSKTRTGSVFPINEKIFEALRWGGGRERERRKKSPRSGFALVLCFDSQQRV